MAGESVYWIEKLINIGIVPSKLTALDRLCYVDNNGLGALVYEPQRVQNRAQALNVVALDDLFEDIKQVETDQSLLSEYCFDNVFNRGGSSVGARPKIYFKYNSMPWIVKFRSSLADPVDLGNIEYAYNLMAKKAGLVIPNIKLFDSKKCGGYFGVQRFDRVNGKRIHMQSISGLLHADF